ncbi:MAG: PilZ domain-containing protein [Dehalococcoidia bacterium]
MSEEDFWKEYRKILDEHRDSAAAKDAAPPEEKRAHPRLQVNTEALRTETIPEAVVENLSVSGIAIRANHPQKTGATIQISLNNFMSVKAEVVGCKMILAPDEYTDGEFLIRGRFLEDMKGMELVVKTVRNT